MNPNHKMNALLEIGLEEVPSRFMPAILADLKAKAEKELQSSRLTFKTVCTYGTPRRLVLCIEGLSAKQEDLVKEVKGPSREQAFNGNGHPTKAAEGFAASQGISVTDLKIKKAGDREFVFASVSQKGVEAEKILEDLFPKLIRSLYLPISMRWGSVEYKFIRPLHWIFAACGTKVINFEIAGVRSSNKTCGHRYFSKGFITIDLKKGVSFEPFKKALFNGKVIVDQNERKEKIAAMVNAAAKKIGGEAMMDNDLLDEVNFLVEWPVAVTGSFKKEFLELPKDVLVTSMKKNQKYFSVTTSSGKLLPAFVNITNGIAQADTKNVVEGNERVLTARLSDAQFFFSEDRKKLLKDLIPGLAKVAFYDKLGTIYEKVERITALSDWIAKELKIPEQQRENIREIAKLCKTDLLTHMVYEFPSLQGVMGREYSLLEGKPKEIASGIYEHYLPRFADDALPASTEGAIVSIADKIDSITGCFSIGIIPSGSEDPFGLRRQAQGVVSVLSGKKIELELDSLIEKAYKFYEPLFLGELFITGKVKYDQVDKVKSNVLAFLAARLKGMMLDDGISYDVADAVLAVFKSVPDSRAKARELQKHIKEEWFKKLVFTADRISRLAKNATRGNVIEADLAVEEEKALYALYLEVNAAMNEALDVNDITKALQALTKLTKPVDDLFIKVMVMDKDERLKANRLALLKTLERTYMEIADFSKIVI